MGEKKFSLEIQRNRLKSLDCSRRLGGILALSSLAAV